MFSVAATAERTWLVGDTTNVETLVTGKEGIALYCDGWQLSLSAVLAGGNNARKGWRDDGAEGGEDDELHVDDCGRRREIKV